MEGFSWFAVGHLAVSVRGLSSVCASGEISLILLIGSLILMDSLMTSLSPKSPLSKYSKSRGWNSKIRIFRGDTIQSRRVRVCN